MYYIIINLSEFSYSVHSLNVVKIFVITVLSQNMGRNHCGDKYIDWEINFKMA